MLKLRSFFFETYFLTSLPTKEVTVRSIVAAGCVVSAMYDCQIEPNLGDKIKDDVLYLEILAEIAELSGLWLSKGVLFVALKQYTLHRLFAARTIWNKNIMAVANCLLHFDDMKLGAEHFSLGPPVTVASTAKSEETVEGAISVSDEQKLVQHPIFEFLPINTRVYLCLKYGKFNQISTLQKFSFTKDQTKTLTEKFNLDPRTISFMLSGKLTIHDNRNRCNISFLSNDQIIVVCSYMCAQSVKQTNGDDVWEKETSPLKYRVFRATDYFCKGDFLNGKELKEIIFNGSAQSECFAGCTYVLGFEKLPQHDGTLQVNRTVRVAVRKE
jgi:hypothetical protein